MEVNKTNFELRNVKETELSEVLEIYRSVSGTEFCTWNEYYPGMTEINSDFAKNNLFVLIEDKKIIGTASIVSQNEYDEMPFWACKDNVAEIARLAIIPECQNKGLASYLLNEIENKALYNGFSAIHLLVAEKNIPAYRTYMKSGYRVMGECDLYGNHYFACEKRLFVIRSERLFLREINLTDFDALFAVLGDSDIMKHYPYTFDEKRVRGWIIKNIDRYREFGFGLWAVCLNETGEMIGDCGLTIQNINGALLPEIGYHIRKDFQRKGYAKEAATAVKKWAFENTSYDILYSYMKAENVASSSTAKSIGMKQVNEYIDNENGKTLVFGVSK